MRSRDSDADEQAAPGEEAPWWRSEADMMDDAEDPVALHLAARNGVAIADHAAAGEPTTDAPSSIHAPWATAAGAGTATAGAEAATPARSATGGAGGTAAGTPGDVADPDDAHGHDGAAHDPASSHDRGRSSAPGDGPTGAQAHHGDCDVCPICRGLAHVRATHPELAEHLVAAARHLTLAMREVVDTIGAAATDSTAGQSPPWESADRPERSEHTDRSAPHGRPARSGRSARSGPSRQGGSPPASGFEAIPLDDMDTTDDMTEREDEA